MVFWLKKSSGIPEKGRKIDFLPGRRALLMKTAYTQGYLSSDLRSLDQKPDKRRLNKRILFLNLCYRSMKTQHLEKYRVEPALQHCWWEFSTWYC